MPDLDRALVRFFGRFPFALGLQPESDLQLLDGVFDGRLLRRLLGFGGLDRTFQLLLLRRGEMADGRGRSEAAFQPQERPEQV